MSGSGEPVVSGSGSGNPPPPPPDLSGSGGAIVSGSGNPPPPAPNLSGSGGTILSGSGSGDVPPPPWTFGLRGHSVETLTTAVSFTAASGTSTSATAVLQAVSVSGTDHGSLLVRTTGLQPGVYSVSAVTVSSTDSIPLGTFKVRVPATTGTASAPPERSNTCFGGPRGIPFPSGFDPFDIASLAISDSNSNILFTAELGTVTDGAFYAQVPLVSGTSVPAAAGVASIHACANAGVVTGSLVVNASGLPASTSYTYAINGTDIATVTTGSKGSLHLVATENPTTGTLPGTVDLFTVTAVTIHDGSGNVILSASF